MAKKLGFDEVMGVVAMLAGSKGFYGRVARAVADMDDDELAAFEDAIDAADLHDAVDVVMWFEA